jgi:AraC family transcriptional regulator
VTAGWARLLPVLAHIQAHLERNLSLAVLSKQAGLSPSRFHHVFAAAVGETPRAYVERLRIERAAFRLLIHESSMLRIAIDSGYRNPETFSRAFRRRYDLAPRAYRTWAEQQISTRTGAARGDRALVTDDCTVSATKVTQLRPAHLACIRHRGPYELVPESLFDELEAWARRRRIPGPRIWMGIGYDAPTMTAPEQLRFDAALVVPAPFVAQNDIGYQYLGGGAFATTTHVGGYHTLPTAYARVFPRLRSLRGYQVIGLPAIEIYHTSVVNLSARLNQTDICLPVVPRVR